jgi:antitoxin (DNA-binding transcriptional repressor) of toxin-antitoxin stability system
MRREGRTWEGRGCSGILGILQPIPEQATITIGDVQSRLHEVIAGLNPGEPLVITQNGEPVATLTRSDPPPKPRKAGSAKNQILGMSPDFDAPLDEFRESME